MSAMVLLRNKAAFTAKPARASRTPLRVQAAATNVQEARTWINTWRSQQASAAAALNRTAPWFPGTMAPAYLDGSLPGDFGFDPLRLGEDPAKLSWYVQAELVHARFAMLAAAGILGPELFSSIGIQWGGAGVAWYDAGKFQYFAPTSTLLAIQFLLFAWVEIRRYQDMVKPGSANVDPVFSSNKLPDGNTPGYPGGIFDPFGWSKGDFSTLKLKEIKNGRLAMLAFVGFTAQHFTTGTTPLSNLGTHLADPWNSTVWSNDIARL